MSFAHRHLRRQRGYHRELLFLPEFEKILRASQQRKQVQVFRNTQELMCGRTIHCERPSECRWHGSQVDARSSPASHVLRIFHRSSGCGTPSTCRLARFTCGSSARDRPSQKPSGTSCQKISDCHALYVLALHGVVPRLAVSLHSLFSEECLNRDLHVFRRSSRKVWSSRSTAVGRARPYMRSASV